MLKIGLEEFLTHPGVRPLPPCGPCQVTACVRDRDGTGVSPVGFLVASVDSCEAANTVLLWIRLFPLNVKALDRVHDQVCGVFAPLLDIQHFLDVLDGQEDDDLAVLAVDTISLKVG